MQCESCGSNSTVPCTQYHIKYKEVQCMRCRVGWSSDSSRSSSTDTTTPQHHSPKPNSPTVFVLCSGVLASGHASRLTQHGRVTIRRLRHVSKCLASTIRVDCVWVAYFLTNVTRISVTSFGIVWKIVCQHLFFPNFNASVAVGSFCYHGLTATH